MPWSSIGIENDELTKSEYGSGTREINYTAAIREALEQSMRLDHSVYLMGQGINDKNGMFGATADLYREFGERRVFDTPLSEAALTGVATGSAVAGLKPVYFHNRPDFLLLAMDQIVNHASKYSYMSGGQYRVPLVIWAVTGKGWGSGPQHSQSLHGLFMHIPGLKIIMPTTPYDAKGLMCSAIADPNPVLIFEHRMLFNQTGKVPQDIYRIPLGKGIIRRKGTDVTIVAISEMVDVALKAAEQIEKTVSCEVIDLRTIKPYDKDLVIKSAKKTGRVLIADTGWRTGGAASAICSDIYPYLYKKLKGPIEILALPDCPTPASYAQENFFYRNEADMIDLIEKVMNDEA